MYGNDDYGMSGWMWWWSAAMVVGVLVLLGGLVWAIVVTTRRPAGPGQPVPSAVGPSAARQILDQRYARGEMDTPEYQERVHTLGSAA